MTSRKQPLPHPPPEQLLRLSDGELPPREAGAVRSHVKLCWECRSRLEQMEGGIAQYMRYQENVLKPLLPQPPKPWTDLYRRMEELDKTIAFRRKPLLRVAPRMGMSVAAAVVLAIAVLWRFDRIPEVSAAELLWKASVAEASAPVKPRRIRIKTPRRSLTRMASLRNSGAHATAAVSGGPDDLERLFAQARYSWDDPLSVDVYRAWRNQLSQKTEQVHTMRDSSGTPNYLIHTETVASVLTEATITLRARDLHAVHERLQFGPGEWVEINEIPDSEADTPVSAVSKPSTPPSVAPPATEKDEALVIGKVSAEPAKELQVVAALHRIGADLGEPIEVNRDGSKLLVAGMGLGSQRQSQIEAAIAEIPGVEAHFDQPESMGSHPNTTYPQRRAREGTRSALQLQLESRLKDGISLEEFTNRVLDASDAAMARAHALRALARRFPPDVAAQLTSSDLKVLAGLRRDHLVALTARVREIHRLLEPALSDLGDGPSTTTAPPAQWQARTQQLFVAAQRVDQLLTAMLAGSDTRSNEETTSELATALSRLEDQLATR